MSDNNNTRAIRLVNTPYTYAKLGNKYNLLQQDILVKVIKHLQHYLQEYFGSDLSKSKKVPRPLFSDDSKKQLEFEKIRVDYSELGVAPNNFHAARIAAQDVLSVAVPGPIEVVDGVRKQTFYNVFTEVTVEADSSAVICQLNTKMLDKVFDMSKGYVSHPEDIAQIANVEKMPLLYYLLKHEMHDWKKRCIRLTVMEIKEFLGMVEYDEANIPKKIAYKKFSQFKERVMVPTLSDIDRLKQQGLIDVAFNVEYIYKGKTQRGDPAYIEFSIKDDGKKQRQRPVEQDIFAEEQKPEYDTNAYLSFWQETVARYEGPLKDALTRARYMGAKKGDYPEVAFMKDDIPLVNQHIAEWKKVCDTMTSLHHLPGKIGVKKNIK